MNDTALIVGDDVNPDSCRDPVAGAAGMTRGPANRRTVAPADAARSYQPTPRRLYVYINQREDARQQDAIRALLISVFADDGWEVVMMRQERRSPSGVAP